MPPSIQPEARRAASPSIVGISRMRTGTSAWSNPSSQRSMSNCVSWTYPTSRRAFLPRRSSGTFTSSPASDSPTTLGNRSPVGSRFGRVEPQEVGSRRTAAVAATTVRTAIRFRATSHLANDQAYF
jgi:hypothetical protein